MITKTRKTESSAEAIKAIINIANNLSIDKVCELRNQFITDEVAIIDEQQMTIFTLEEIESWAERIDLTYEKRQDVDGCPWHYELNGCRSEERFYTEREAMVSAFTDIIVKNADLGDYDLFTCQKCDEYFDIEDSVQIDGDELYCSSCASKAQ
jgi:hypothetical protein